MVEMYEADLDGRCENCGMLIGFTQAHEIEDCVAALKVLVARVVGEVLPQGRRCSRPSMVTISYGAEGETVPALCAALEEAYGQIDHLLKVQDEHLQLLSERDMLRKEVEAVDAALWDGSPCSYADDIEHFITCHADTLPQTARLLARTVVAVQQAGLARHEKEDPG